MKKAWLLFVLVFTGFCTLNAQILFSIQVGTGSDDLRGGSDNVNLIVLMKSGSQVRINNLNQSTRWADNSTKNVTQGISTGKIADVAGFRLEVTFSGGYGGDNWNLNRLIINGIVSNVATKMVDVSGNPLYRFTGDNRVKDFPSLTASSTTSTSTTVSAPAVMTKFNPPVHGFKFVNNLSYTYVTGTDWIGRGLCLGMSFAALDYYKTSRTIPQQTYAPAEGMPLQSYLYGRHMAGNSASQAKLIELNFNPDGIRNREFFNWGLQAGSGQLGVLQSYIDRGEPIPIGLVDYGGQGAGGNHCVLAIGYQLGRYKGDLGSYIEDLTIFVYDPNHPGRIMNMKANNAGAFYAYSEEPAKPLWRTYFVETAYSIMAPPVIPLNPKEIIASFRTGDDDLRGGNDNVNLIIMTRVPDPARRGSYLTFRFDNVNNGKRWINNSWQEISRPLPDNYRKEDVTGFRIETTFSGGTGGDNWNLNEIYISTRINGAVESMSIKKGTPFFRFTGDQKSLEIRYP